MDRVTSKQITNGVFTINLPVFSKLFIKLQENIEKKTTPLRSTKKAQNAFRKDATLENRKKKKSQQVTSLRI